MDSHGGQAGILEKFQSGTFLSATADDEKLESLWKKEFGLKEFSEKKQFKSYDQLKGRLDKVLGFDGAVTAPKTKAADTVVSNFKEEDTSILDKATTADDEDLDYFKSLADE